MNKNKIVALSVIAFVAGMGIGAWGMIREDAPIGKSHKGSVTLMILGGGLIVGGAIGMYTNGWKGK